jgi:hypothetical protein
MDYFEYIIKGLLEERGYWVRQSVKVNLTKEEKRAIGKPSIPRPELDLVGYNPSRNELLMVEVKSFLDSPGVRASDMLATHDIPDGRYKLITCPSYCGVVQNRIVRDWSENGLICKEPAISKTLAAGKVYRGQEQELMNALESRGWGLISPTEIKGYLQALADRDYENEAVVIAAKMLLR